MAIANWTQNWTWDMDDKDGTEEKTAQNQPMDVPQEQDRQSAEEDGQLQE